MAIFNPAGVRVSGRVGGVPSLARETRQARREYNRETPLIHGLQVQDVEAYPFLPGETPAQRSRRLRAGLPSWEQSQATPTDSWNIYGAAIPRDRYGRAMTDVYGNPIDLPAFATGNAAMAGTGTPPAAPAPSAAQPPMAGQEPPPANMAQSSMMGNTFSQTYKPDVPYWMKGMKGARY